MNGLLRVASFGGWLAHQVNQEWKADHSGFTRLGFLGYVGAVAGLTAGFMAAGLLLRGGDPGNWMGVLLFGGFALLLTVGWLTNTLPFVAAKEDGSAPPRGRRMAAGHTIETHATGVVGLGSDRRRFRHRPATLERHPDGELYLAVRTWRRGAAGPERPDVSSLTQLLPGEITKIRRGTAHLVTQSRPALCFRWRNRPVILDFTDTKMRDRACAQLIALSAEVRPSTASKSQK